MLSRAFRALALSVMVTYLTASPCARAQDGGAAATAEAAPAPAKSPSGKQTVYVGFYVNALREVDAHSQTFRADLFYWIRYVRRVAGLEDDELEEIRFINGDVESQEVEERKALGPDNYVLYRVRAQFHFHANFRRYPFDHQELPIQVQHAYLRADQLELKPDTGSYTRSGVSAERQGLGEDIRLADMYVTHVRHELSTSAYHTDFGDRTDPQGSTTLARYTMVIVAAREVWPFLIKIVIPLLIIQILAYLVFFVAADRIDVAVGLTVTSLLASIAFQISLADSLPDIGYLTTADRIFHLSYFLIMVAMGQMVYAYNLHMAEQPQRARTLDLVGRVLYPIVFFLGVALICLHW